MKRHITFTVTFVLLVTRNRKKVLCSIDSAVFEVTSVTENGMSEFTTEGMIHCCMRARAMLVPTITSKTLRIRNLKQRTTYKQVLKREHLSGDSTYHISVYRVLRTMHINKLGYIHAQWRRMNREPIEEHNFDSGPTLFAATWPKSNRRGPYKHIAINRIRENWANITALFMFLKMHCFESALIIR